MVVLTFMFVIAATTLYDWVTQSSSLFGNAMDANARYATSLLGAVEQGVPVGPLWAVPPATDEYYYSTDGDVVLPGKTISYSVPVSKYTLENDTRALQAASSFVVDVIDEVEPRTRWVNIRLYYIEGFGFASLESSESFLLDCESGTVRFAPVRVREDSTISFAGGHQGRWDHFDVRYFEPRVHHMGWIGLYDWAFGSWNVLGKPPYSTERYK